MFKATFKGCAIVVKVLKVAACVERERLHKVSGFDPRTPKWPFTLLSVAPSQRSYWMEVAPTCEHLAVRGRYIYTFCDDFNCFGIDGKWEYHEFYQEGPGT